MESNITAIVNVYEQIKEINSQTIPQKSIMI